MLKKHKLRFVWFGFTMIEVLVAVAVVGMLSTAGVKIAKQQIDKGRDARRKSDVYRLTASFEEYYNDNDCYPTNADWERASCEEGSPDLSSYLDSFPCDPTTKEKYTYQTIDKEGNYCDGVCGECYGYRVLSRLANRADKEIVKVGCDPDEGCGVEVSDGKPSNWGIAMGGKVPVPGFYPGQGEDVGHTDKHDCLHSKDPDCEEPSPLPSPSPVIGQVTIRGRFINYFTREPIAGAFLAPNLGGAILPTPSNSNGEFTIVTRVDDLEPLKEDNSNYSKAKKVFSFYSSPIYCYLNEWFKIERRGDSSLYVSSEPYDLDRNNYTNYPVNGPDVDVGDITMWPAANTIRVLSDIEVKYTIWLLAEGNGFGHISYKTEHYNGGYTAFNSAIRAELEDREGNIYYSPEKIYDRSLGCDKTIILKFFDGVFTWE